MFAKEVSYKKVLPFLASFFWPVHGPFFTTFKNSLAADTSMQVPVDIYRRMAQAVPTARKGELDASLQRFAGDYRLLEAFLEKFGSDNPWEAAKEAHLRRALWRAPEESAEVLGVSESGHKLTRELYLFEHTYDPTRTWVSGSQAITRILEIWGTDNQRDALTPDGRQKIKSRKKQQVRETLDEFAESLEEVLKDPWKLKDIQSTNERHEVRKILQIDELKRRVQQLHDLVYGNTAFLDDARPSYLLAMDPGGTFWGRLERKKGELPMSIRDIYTTITDPLVEIPEQERRFMMGTLIAWCAMDVPVRRDAALGGYQQDLDFILKLPDSHPIVQKHGKPDLTKIVSILERSEITLMEAAKVFDAYPVNEVRREFNKAYASLYRQEVDATLQRLEDCFLAERQWREDSIGDSVPLKRLKETEYAKILDRDDFYHVRNLLRARTLAPGDKVYQTATLGEWKQMIDGVVTAGRKLRQIDGGQGGKKVEELLRGKYRLAEDVVERYGLSLLELLERVDFLRQRKRIAWTALRERMKRAADLQLYLPAEMEAIEPLLDQAKELQPFQGPVPKDAFWDIFVVQDRHFSLPSGKYATPRERQELKAYKEIFQYLQSLPRAEVARRKLRQAGPLYDVKREAVVHVTMTPYAPPTIEKNGVLLIDVPAATARLEELRRDYVVARELPSTWRNESRLVFRCPEWLRKKTGLQEVSWLSGETLERMPPEGNVHHELVDFVTNSYQQLKKAFAYDASVIAQGAEKLAQAELYALFQVAVTGVRKQEVSQVFSRLRYEGRRAVGILSAAEIGGLTLNVAYWNKENGRRMKVIVGV